MAKKRDRHPVFNSDSAKPGNTRHRHKACGKVKRY